ncbi:MAG TPA: hypothetical protein VF746_15640 [Longimicrobium sp.]|jgi:hypothetical protein
MAEGKTASGEIAAGLGSIFSRIGEFFHIFDLSFFVGGASSFAALSFLYLMMRKPQVFPFSPWVGVLALIVACYICGLIAFAVGREISGRTFRKSTLHRTLPVALAAHGLTEESITSYTTGDKPRFWWLYIRMWSEVAHEPSSPIVLQHLMRYWAMAATYDGVAFSFLVWAAVLFAVQFRGVAPQPIGHGLGITGALLCIGAAFFAFRRGAVYFEYQIEDVVAHFAVSRGHLVGASVMHPSPGG